MESHKKPIAALKPKMLNSDGGSKRKTKIAIARATYIADSIVCFGRLPLATPE